ncbi:MAG TPA: hypothetical protein VF611_14875, partial [Pyrinomonadaceae bacterium]
MNKFLKVGPAVLLLACAPRAWAQEPQAGKPAGAKSGEAVRERRVAAAESRAGADKPADESAEESADKLDKSDAARDESGETSAEVEALRARAESAASPSERGRLRLGLAERLTEAGRRAEAAELLRSMLGEERFDPQLFYNAGNALARLGESDAAADA